MGDRDTLAAEGNYCGSPGGHSLIMAYTGRLRRRHVFKGWDFIS